MATALQTPERGSLTPASRSASDVQRVGGGYVQQSPCVDAQLRAAKQKVLDLWAQLEQRTRQLSAMHAKLTSVTSDHQTCAAKVDQLSRQLAATSGEKERMALQITQLQESLQTSEAAADALRTKLAEHRSMLRENVIHGHAQSLFSEDEQAAGAPRTPSRRLS